MTRIVAGDIGGTNIRLVLWEDGNVVRHERYATADFAQSGLGEAVRVFLDGALHPDAASFGIAGPVVGDRVIGTNLPFDVTVDEIRSKTLAINVILLNDLEATAWGTLELEDHEWQTLVVGEPVQGAPVAIAALGTGFGACQRLVVDGAPTVIAGEMGQGNFAPSDEELLTISSHLMANGLQPSVEDVLSGPGLTYVHSVLSGTSESMAPAAILGLAAENDAAAVRTVNAYVRALGHELRNISVRFLARGGVCLGGGVIAGLLPFLTDGTFERAFRGTRNAADLVLPIPVRASLVDDVAIRGALLRAQTQLNQ